ncbi:glycosyltransferase family 39 protein [Leptolyngbya sp. FACHB-261]|uniref:glycosyltransferase family 39 protein n=1 Tax=Leptolyngbya sp. FACHB-261 TaxID=2692806 RepID=UPI0016829E51|nr:glycosyltransferase family 39 protein [Leptolyngbya sp. FACHB-261]MBD2104277.1 glycosyltransferase family 39 protein [Leptolyngbya sp. FACHB-261]
MSERWKTAPVRLGVGWADIAVLVLGLLVLTCGLGGYGFYEPHEGHFAGVAREMLLRNDWVTPTLNGAPYLNKPPLLYWLIATSTKLFGFNEFAARLPVALAGWLGAVVAWKWARELWNPTAGRMAAAMLCMAAGWFLFTHQILIDVLLASLLLASYYCLWRFLWEPRRWRYCLALYGLLGLCILTKGPVGLFFPVLSWVGLALNRRSFASFQKARLVLGAGVILAVILPWVVAVERANPGFLKYFLLNENLSRIADVRWPPDYAVSKVSALGYLAVAGIWGIPWTLLLPQALSSAWQDWQQGRSPEATWSQRRRSEGMLLLTIAAAAPLLLFLPMSSRLVYYSLPALPPVILLCAGWWSRCREPGQRQGQRSLGWVFALLGLVVGTGAFWLPRLVVNLPELANIAGLHFTAAFLLLALGASWLVAGVLLLARWPYRALVGLCLGLSLVWATVANGFATTEAVRSSRQLIAAADPRLGLETLWVFEGSRELGAAGAMSYYLDRRGGHPLAEVPGATRTAPLPPGWARGRAETAYRTVMVLTDGGVNRLPPVFPGPAPAYATNRRQLQEFWDSTRPVVFVTDFLRQPNDPQDPLDLNLPISAKEPLQVVGPRQLYGNAAAQEHWEQSCASRGQATAECSGRI